MIRGQISWTLKQHLPFQAFYVAFYSGYMPFLLFLPIYLKLNGLSAAQVGLIVGLRPLLQAIGAPILIKLATKCHAKKLLFAVSCILTIGKLLMIFIVLRPGQAICRTTYSDGQVKDTLIEHSLTKRDVEINEWSEVVSYSPNDISSKYFHTKNVTERQNYTTNTSSSWPRVRSAGGKSSNERNLANSTAIVQYRIDHEHEVYFIFMAILILGLTTDCFDACIFTLVDNMYRSNVTWVLGDTAWGVITLIIGVFIDKSRDLLCGEMIGSFHLVFFFNVAFITIALMIGLFLELNIETHDADFSRKVQSSKWNFQYNIFILAYSLMGFCNGFLFSFIYWYIDILDGNALIMGLSTTTECLVCFFAFFIWNRILEHIGHMSAVCVGFVGYIGVFLSYYGVNNPWFVVAVKALQALISGIMMFACNAFLSGAAPAGSSYEMQGKELEHQWHQC